MTESVVSILQSDEDERRDLHGNVYASVLVPWKYSMETAVLNVGDREELSPALSRWLEDNRSDTNKVAMSQMDVREEIIRLAFRVKSSPRGFNSGLAVDPSAFDSESGFNYLNQNRNTIFNGGSNAYLKFSDNPETNIQLGLYVDFLWARLAPAFLDLAQAEHLIDGVLLEESRRLQSSDNLLIYKEKILTGVAIQAYQHLETLKAEQQRVEMRSQVKEMARLAASLKDKSSQPRPKNKRRKRHF